MTRNITLVALLSAICVVSRIVLQFLPNIKPVTTIIILVALYIGATESIEVAFVSTMVSNMVLGMGIWTVFQILSWVVIAVLASILSPVLKRLSPFALSLYSAANGFLFGFIVSWEKLLYVGVKGFWIYYISGIPFDVLHAVGNFAFCLVFAIPLKKVFENNSLRTGSF